MLPTQRDLHSLSELLSRLRLFGRLYHPASILDAPRARNSPVATNLEAQCRTAQLLAAQRREAELLKG
jgi:hypothetical protein